MFFSCLQGYCTDKKEDKIFLVYKEIQPDRVQSHIWLTASSYIVKYFRISSYIRKPFLIYDFAHDPIWISLYMRKILFSFLSVCRQVKKYWQSTVSFVFDDKSYIDNILVSFKTGKFCEIGCRYTVYSLKMNAMNVKFYENLCEL